MLRYGQLRYAGKQRPLKERWESSLRSREKRRTSHWSNETQGRFANDLAPDIGGRCLRQEALKAVSSVAVSQGSSPSARGLMSQRLRRAEEPSLGTGYIVRVRKIGLIEAGYRDLVRKSRSRASASRDDCLFLLHVILAWFRPDLVLETVSKAKLQLNKKMVVRYRFTVLDSIGRSVPARCAQVPRSGARSFVLG